jgi:hypothetical protein
LKIVFKSFQKLKVVREYAALYAAFLGFVSQPAPRGALIPRLLLTMRFTEVRAAMLFLREGFLIPIFILLEDNIGELLQYESSFPAGCTLRSASKFAAARQNPC